MTTHPGEDQAGASSLPRYPVLDVFRGGAVVTVVVFHCLVSTPTTSGHLIDNFIQSLTALMTSALDLFFVISGFLITLILDRTRDADHTIRTFYIRRALRIIPLYYGFLLFAALFLQYLGPYATGAPGSTKWEWLFLTNFVVGFKTPAAVGALYPHFWSLAVEEHFYLLWPWVVVFVKPKRLIPVCAAVALASLAGRIGMSMNGYTYASWLITPTRLDGLAIGSMVAMLHRYRPEILERFARPVLWSGLLVMLLFILVPSLVGIWSSTAIRTVGAVGAPFVDSLIFGSIVAISAARNQRSRITGLVGKTLKSVARYSYGMYALHVPIMVMLFHTGHVQQSYPIHGYDFPYRLGFTAMILTLSYLCGLASWHLYEKVVLRLAPSYQYGSNTRDTSAVADNSLRTLPVP